MVMGTDDDKDELSGIYSPSGVAWADDGQEQQKGQAATQSFFAPFIGLQTCCKGSQLLR